MPEKSTKCKPEIFVDRLIRVIGVGTTSWDDEQNYSGYHDGDASGDPGSGLERQEHPEHPIVLLVLCLHYNPHALFLKRSQKVHHCLSGSGNGEGPDANVRFLRTKIFYIPITVACVVHSRSFTDIDISINFSINKLFSFHVYCIDGDNVKIEISTLRCRATEIQTNIKKFAEFWIQECRDWKTKKKKPFQQINLSSKHETIGLPQHTNTCTYPSHHHPNHPSSIFSVISWPSISSIYWI